MRAAFTAHGSSSCVTGLSTRGPSRVPRGHTRVPGVGDTPKTTKASLGGSSLPLFTTPGCHSPGSGPPRGFYIDCPVGLRLAPRISLSEDRVHRCSLVGPPVDSAPSFTTPSHLTHVCISLPLRGPWLLGSSPSHGAITVHSLPRALRL